MEPRVVVVVADDSVAVAGGTAAAAVVQTHEMTVVQQHTPAGAVPRDERTHPRPLRHQNWERA